MDQFSGSRPDKHDCYDPSTTRKCCFTVGGYGYAYVFWNVDDGAVNVGAMGGSSNGTQVVYDYSVTFY